MRKRLIFSLLMLTLPLLVQAQVVGNPSVEASLPLGYEGFLFGQTLKEVKTLLESSTNLWWKGDPDVTMLARPNTSLLEVDGAYYIKRAAFQFVEDGLYSITLVMNEDKIDYYSLFEQLNRKYGRPQLLNPQKAQWESSDTFLSLEKPMTVKYLNRPVLESLRQGVQTQSSQQRILREDFLGTL